MYVEDLIQVRNHRFKQSFRKSRQVHSSYLQFL